MPGYEYDVFISYSNVGSAPKWLVNNFFPKFQDCLADQIAPAPRVFLDRTMHRGVSWPEKLARVLLRSKILIPVLSPPYFESAWCMAEWDSMCERERVLGLAGSDCPQGLIYPILYSDSNNFPEKGTMRAWWDFKDVAMPEAVFQVSPGWSNFHEKVVRFAEDLSELLKQVPDWQPDWPVIRSPQPLLMPPPSIPRFGP
ncbi:TIR domain-containing protein [Amycolatopsis aidingensis]|uniref:TIR domain-containing protein n=1 Tax=Amycolatopsis aidingensis TaxID=2842453 RepID=UPI001C0BD4CB|nr:TIR domain-containing protein [Amycolatopsis aidingensis]